MKRIALLGSTGSIGTQTLDVVRLHPERFRITAVAAGRNVDLVRKQIEEFSPEIAAVHTKEDAETLQAEYGGRMRIVWGHGGLMEIAGSSCDFLMNAVSGSMGLEPTLRAIENRVDIGIANKETLVTAGHLVMEKAKEHGVRLLPVDSEHSAIAQCLEGNDLKEVSRLILTASGGSFRDYSRSDLDGVTVEDALNHPNWSMGAKITIDSATMMNKGFEVIEAHWLFGIPYDRIDVLLHKESIIHSLVEYQDTSVIAQLGLPDMRVPIQYAMTYPERLDYPAKESLNLWEIGTLHFQPPDFERYRSLRLAYDAGRAGGSMGTVLNAANEQAVAMFLNSRCAFLEIETAVEEALLRHERIEHPDLDTILRVDRETREHVQTLLT